jgi:hypothetical protein
MQLHQQMLIPALAAGALVAGALAAGGYGRAMIPPVIGIGTPVVAG